jgi:hypothetical protein
LGMKIPSVERKRLVSRKVTFYSEIGLFRYGGLALPDSSFRFTG